VGRDPGSTIRVNIEESKFLACVDTGSPFNLVPTALWKKILEQNKNIKPVCFKERLDIKGVGGTMVLAEDIVYVNFEP